jgi:hypothetical protein
MSYVTVNGTTYSGFALAFNGGVSSPADGIYYALPPYGQPPVEGAVIKDEKQIKFVGVAGVGIKEMGAKTRPITMELIIVGSSKSAVESSKATLLTAVSGTTRFSVTVPGGTARLGCRLVPGSGNPIDSWTIGNKICLRVSLSFMNYGEAE